MTDGPGYLPRSPRMAAGRIGSAVTATPSGFTASATALAITAGAPIVPPSPLPL